MGDREVDQQLVERAQRGDKRAFELLVLKYQRKLARLLSRLVRDAGEVEDVTQEAFIKAYRALPSFRGESAFYTWLYRIAINTAKNYLVAIGRRGPHPPRFFPTGRRKTSRTPSSCETRIRRRTSCWAEKSRPRSTRRWTRCPTTCALRLRCARSRV